MHPWICIFWRVVERKEERVGGEAGEKRVGPEMDLRAHPARSRSAPDSSGEAWNLSLTPSTPGTGAALVRSSPVEEPRTGHESDG
jgi:hypothetical protein